MRSIFYSYASFSLKLPEFGMGIFYWRGVFEGVFCNGLDLGIQDRLMMDLFEQLGRIDSSLTPELEGRASSRASSGGGVVLGFGIVIGVGNFKVI